MLCRIVIGLMLVASTMMGQSGSASTSIYTVLFTNRASTGVSSNVTNIGQVGHQVFVYFSDAPGHTCTGTNVAAGLEFSYDNSLWFDFGNPSNAVTVNNVVNQTYFGTGGYPFVRFLLFTFDTTNCRANAYYTGSSAQALLSSSQVVVGTPVYDGVTGISHNPVTVVGGVAGVSGAFPLYTCNSQIINAGGTPSGAGTYLVGTASINTGYGVCNLTASSAGVATVQLIQGGGSSCGTSTRVLTPPFNIVAGVPFKLGESIGLITRTLSETSSANNNLCIVITGTVSYLVNLVVLAS